MQPDASSSVQVLDAVGMGNALDRMAAEILAAVPASEPLALVGIHTRGVPLAQRLAARMALLDPARPPCSVGELDVSFHRDDLNRMIRVPKGTEIPFNLDGKWIVLVDDVLYTGRTIRAALNAMTDMGRATTIQLAVLIDRGHRQLPICADYIGKSVSTTKDARVYVHLKETDGQDDAWVSNHV